MLASTVCTFEDFKWADSVVSSRTIGMADARSVSTATLINFVPFEGYTSQQVKMMFDLPDLPNLALVPVLDLCNHAGRRRTARWDFLPVESSKTCAEDSLEILCLVAEAELQAGDEITISYGDEKTNEELFYNYGFCDSDNPNWRISLLLQHDIDPKITGIDDEYWAMIRDTYKVPKIAIFTNHDYLVQESESTDGAVVSENKRRWQIPGHLKVALTAFCTMVLLKSEQWVGSPMISKLLCEEDADNDSDRVSDSDMMMLRTTANAILLHSLAKKIEHVTVQLDQDGGRIDKNSHILLKDEERGLHVLMTAFRASVPDEVKISLDMLSS